jgi:hypothetical protein
VLCVVLMTVLMFCVLMCSCVMTVLINNWCVDVEVLMIVMC